MSSSVSQSLCSPMSFAESGDTRVPSPPKTGTLVHDEKRFLFSFVWVQVVV